MPFDLDAVIAEATGAPYEFTFGGETFTLPPDADVFAVQKMAAGEIGDALKLLLGSDQYARMETMPGTFGVKAFEALMTDYMRHVGSSVGESQASTGSSASTERPSNPTSSVSTGLPSPTSSVIDTVAS